MKGILVLVLLAAAVSPVVAEEPVAVASPVTAEEPPDLTVVATDLPAYRLAYVRIVGAYGDAEVINAAFEQIMTWAKENGLFGDDSVFIGVSQDDPEITPMEECRYDACVTVPEGTEGEGDVGVYELPAGRYAVYTTGGEFENIAEEMEKTYGDLMAWWPAGGYEFDERPWLEIYGGAEGEYEAGKYAVDICVPIKGE